MDRQNHEMFSIFSDLENELSVTLKVFAKNRLPKYLSCNSFSVFVLPTSKKLRLHIGLYLSFLWELFWEDSWVSCWIVGLCFSTTVISHSLSQYYFIRRHTCKCESTAEAFINGLDVLILPGLWWQLIQEYFPKKVTSLSTHHLFPCFI